MILYPGIKRFFDALMAGLILGILLPFFVPMMMLLKCTGEGDVWYLQERIGHRNKRFKIWKFATMLRASPKMLTGSITLRNDPRVTQVGKFLRSTKLNEVPQLINVLMGEMSMVGPRPQMEIDFMAYPEHIRDRIYRLLPGITGIGSVFFRDEEKMISEATMEPRRFYDAIIAPYKGLLELWYQDNMSFKTDLKIICLTVMVVLNPGLRVSRYFSNLPEPPTELEVYF